MDVGTVSDVKLSLGTMNLQDLASQMTRRKLPGKFYPAITPRLFKQMFDRFFPKNNSISKMDA